MTNISSPSVQALILHMHFNEQPLATGTGFAVSTPKGPVLITNRHNVTGRHPETNQPLSPTGGIPNRLSIWHNRASHLGQWLRTTEPLYQSDDRPVWVEHPILKERADFVAIRLTQLHDVTIYPYDPSSPGPDIHVGPADTISVIGFPFGMTGGGAFALWATGFVASEPEIDFNGLPIVLIDCRSRPGQSGSPVIAYRSGGMIAMANGDSVAFSGPVYKFLGIYSGRVNAESDLGMVWKASSIAQLIASI